MKHRLYQPGHQGRSFERQMFINKKVLLVDVKINGKVSGFVWLVFWGNYGEAWNKIRTIEKNIFSFFIFISLILKSFIPDLHIDTISLQLVASFLYNMLNLPIYWNLPICFVICVEQKFLRKRIGSSLRAILSKTTRPFFQTRNLKQ